MREQRRAARTVTTVRVTTTKTKVGDSTEVRVSAVVVGAIFEPERLAERPGEDGATVLQSARWNLPGVHDLDSDDLIVDGTDVWYVVGGSSVLLDRSEVPVTRTRSV